MDTKSAIQIGLAIALLGSFFITYLSAKTWQAAHVVLVFMIFLAAGAYWYLAAATLKLHQSYRQVANTLQAEVDTLRLRNAALEAGTDDDELLASLEAAEGIALAGGVRGKRHELRKLTIDRGRVWYECQVGNVAGDGTASLSIEAPDPHRIEAGSVLFAFAQGTLDEGARYLGEFVVGGVGEGTVTIKPSVKLQPGEVQRLDAAKGVAWSLYEIMPGDRHEIFAGLAEEPLQALFPASIGEKPVWQEYARHGSPANPDDPPHRVVEREVDGAMQRFYDRQLHDYERLFRGLHRQQYVDADAILQKKTDTARLQNAIENAQKDIAVLEDEKSKLAGDLKKFENELTLVEKHHGEIDKRLVYLTGRLEETRQLSQKLAAELAQRQLAAARAIDRRTGAVSARGATVLGGE